MDVKGFLTIGLPILLYIIQIMILALIGINEDSREGTFIAGMGNMKKKWRGLIPFFGWIFIIKHIF